MDVFSAICTEKQRECIDYPENRNLLIRGIAGSGKSLVIIRRANRIAKEGLAKGEKRRIAIFTFVNSLVEYTREVVKNKLNPNYDIEVQTLDRYLKNVYDQVVEESQVGKRVFHIQFLIDTGILDDICSEMAKKSKNRFLQPEWRSFLGDELAWMKQHLLKTEEQYLNVTRAGRGKTRPSEKDRRVIFKVYTKYYDTLEQRNVVDANALYEELFDRRDEIPDRCKFDYVLIDESQDLPLNKLLLAAVLTKKSLTFAGDYAQKIYDTGFTWKELGIDMRGNSSKKLTGTFRNTRQIMELAECLSRNNTELMSMREEYVAPVLPDRQGSLPMLHYASSLTDEKDYLLKLVRQLKKQFPKDTIGVIARDSNKIKWIERSFDSAKIRYQTIQQKNNDYSILEPGIKIVTFHSSKGLEFDHVVLVFLEDGSFPFRPSRYNSSAVNDSADSEEDAFNKARNLLYVGMTRAHHTLFMLACDSRSSRPSPLLAELDKKLYKIV